MSDEHDHKKKFDALVNVSVGIIVIKKCVDEILANERNRSKRGL